MVTDERLLIEIRRYESSLAYLYEKQRRRYKVDSIITTILGAAMVFNLILLIVQMERM